MIQLINFTGLGSRAEKIVIFSAKVQGAVQDFLVLGIVERDRDNGIQQIIRFAYRLRCFCLAFALIQKGKQDQDKQQNNCGQKGPLTFYIHIVSFISTD